MPGLSDKLKSLGVKVGAQSLPPSEPAPAWSIEQVAPGRVQATAGGAAYVIETTYPLDHQYGHTDLYPPAVRTAIAEWAGEPRVQDCPPEAFYYLDIETTGLSGGTGTYAFLVGVGCFTAGCFHLRQYFMRDLTEEPGHLLALEDFLAPCQVLVTFNGKAFDVPILNTRFVVQGWQTPFAGLAQLDLLHLARRLWRERFASRTLGNLEVSLLGAERSEQDIPGWLVPQIYFDYLRSGDARPLSGVLYHNAMDVLGLAALLNHSASLLADPLHSPDLHKLDQAAIGRLFEDLGRLDEAEALYRRCLDEAEALEPEVRDGVVDDVLRRLSFICKGRRAWPEALELWEQAARRRQLYAFEELAKYFEHTTKDPAEALRWTEAGLSLIGAPGFPPGERLQWRGPLLHRLERLKHKLA